MPPEDEIELRFEATGLPGAELSVRGAELFERLNEPFDAQVDLIHDGAEPGMDAFGSALLGSPCALTARLRGRQRRVLGVIAATEEVEDRVGGVTRISARVQPALTALRHRVDSRIFQEQTVPEILRRVLGEGLAPFGRQIQVELARAYPPREYTVQYRESDFDFAHRLMEEEGIVYFFDHAGDAEVMVLVDDVSQHPPLPDEVLPFVADLHSDVEADAIGSLTHELAIVGTDVSLRGFDWTHPSVPIEAEASGDGAPVPLEQYEHEHDEPLTYHAYAHTYGAHDASDRARIWRERQARDAELLRADTTSVEARSGLTLEVAGHPDPEIDGGYLVVQSEARFLGRVAVEGAGNRQGLPYTSTLTLLPRQAPFRPDRARPRPRIPSIQTATVVGPAGEEIHTDEHGRVKVQFHWDRLGSRDDHSSCWIRTIQTMGGSGWGFSFVPRIGMEVVVTFVGGDPDRPLVRGVVYNAENPPPYEYPADKTRTTIRTQSSPGGGGHHELRLEDRAGAEEIFLRSQRDWNTLVKNDLTRWVGRDETQDVKRDRRREVGQDERVTIGHDRKRHVARDEQEQVGRHRTRKVGRDEVDKIGDNRAQSIGGDETVTIGGTSSETIQADFTKSVGGNQVESFAQNQVVKVGGQSSVAVAGNQQTKVVADIVEKTGADQLDEVALGFDETTYGSASETIGGSYFGDVRGPQSQILGERRVNVGGADMLTVGSRKTRVFGVHELSSTTFSNTAADQLLLVVGPQRVVQAKTYAMSSGKKVFLKCRMGELKLEEEKAALKAGDGGGILVQAQGKLEIHGDAGVIIDGRGKPVVINGPSIDVKGG